MTTAINKYQVDVRDQKSGMRTIGISCQKTKYQPNTDLLRVYAKSKKFRYHNLISQNKNPTSQLEKQGLKTLSFMTFHRLLFHHLLNAPLERLR